MVHITTTNPQRAAQWEQIFATTHLPVLSDQPRAQQRMGQGKPILAYDLALNELHPWQRIRLAAYVSRRYRLDYDEVRMELKTAVSWPIAAADCVIVEEATESTPLPFLLGILRIITHPRRVMIKQTG